ncbi:MAG: peptidase [Hydrocarboniphaga sp.]|nr:peptidase [Hydrocarboniphaga sp.]
MIVGTVGIALLWLLLFYVAYVFAHSAFISYLRGSAVKLSPEQLPDLYARVQAASRKLGLAKTPISYLLHADGMFNALATRFLVPNCIIHR